MITLDNPKFKLAKQISFKSQHRCRIGAVLVKGKNVFVGFNKIRKTHPEMSKLCSYKKIHAELDCLTGTDRKYLQGGVMYVYRENLNGVVSMAKPCVHCQIILKDVGVKRVFYTDPNEESNIGVLKF